MGKRKVPVMFHDRENERYGLEAEASHRLDSLPYGAQRMERRGMKSPIRFIDKEDRQSRRLGICIRPFNGNFEGLRIFKDMSLFGAPSRESFFNSAETIARAC